VWVDVEFEVVVYGLGLCFVHAESEGFCYFLCSGRVLCGGFVADVNMDGFGCGVEFFGYAGYFEEFVFHLRCRFRSGFL